MKVRIDEDGILFDAQLEWEHEEGKRENEREREREKKQFVRNRSTLWLFSSQTCMYSFLWVFSSFYETDLSVELTMDLFWLIRDVRSMRLRFVFLGIEHSPKLYRKSTEDLLDNFLTQSPRSTSTPYSPDFEWDHLFDFTLWIIFEQWTQFLQYVCVCVCVWCLFFRYSSHLLFFLPSCRHWWWYS